MIMADAKNITWVLTPQEADVVMGALSQRPFAEVVQLIQKLVAQANPGPQQGTLPLDLPPN
jgi:hypothetical protein